MLVLTSACVGPCSQTLKRTVSTSCCLSGAIICHTTWQTCCSQSLSQAEVVLNICSSVLLYLSTNPSPSGVVLDFLISSSLQISCIREDSNCLPWSEWSWLVTEKQQKTHWLTWQLQSQPPDLELGMLLPNSPWPPIYLFPVLLNGNGPTILSPGDNYKQLAVAVLIEKELGIS